MISAKHAVIVLGNSRLMIDRRTPLSALESVIREICSEGLLSAQDCQWRTLTLIGGETNFRQMP